MYTILVIDDDENSRITLARHLKEKGNNILTACDGESGLESIKSDNPDIILLDIRMPGMDGLTLLEELRKLNIQAMVIMLTAFEDMQSTIKAIQLGAYEYMTKPIDIDKLDLTIKRALEVKDLNYHYSNLLTKEQENFSINNIVGRDEKIKKIFKIIGAVSSSTTTVLIQGESGTGKELVARAIHYNSHNKNAPFIAVNCTAIPDTLLESELFGHVKGAFTGANSLKKGRFEVAGCGTIFLDEISEMSPSLQVKLLRVLQERQFERIGSSQSIKSEARVIAATNTDLETLVRNKDFRKDLYYRLKVVEINVPPLRQRIDDIPMLVNHLLMKINNELHKNVCKIPSHIIKIFKRYSWPGNVRELENILTRAVVLSKSDVLLKEYLPQQLLHEDIGEEEKEYKTLKELEKEYILRVLNREHWNKRKAHKILGISRPTLDKKIKDYKLTMKSN